MRQGLPLSPAHFGLHFSRGSQPSPLGFFSAYISPARLGFLSAKSWAWPQHTFSSAKKRTKILVPRCNIQWPLGLISLEWPLGLIIVECNIQAKIKLHQDAIYSQQVTKLPGASAMVDSRPWPLVGTIAGGHRRWPYTVAGKYNYFLKFLFKLKLF